MFDSTRKHWGFMKRAAVLASTTALAVGVGFLGVLPANAATVWAVAGPNGSCAGVGTASTNSTQVSSDNCSSVQAYLTYQNGSSTVKVYGAQQKSVSVASSGSIATSHWGTIWMGSTTGTQYFD